jgi:nitroimidazol reductase NimA-like FMN-containing flavoprotein (pyridoxamine 5'-phosphate oxidase superfamily)
MDDYGVEMTDEEIHSFLTRRGHGVLSFGGDRPYAVPISFGYDASENRCVLQLVNVEDSKKQRYLDESSTVHLAAYEWNSVDDWRSVLIDGHLSPIPSDTAGEIDAADIFFEYADAVSLTIFDRPTAELEPEWYELRIEAMSGRKSPSTG